MAEIPFEGRVSAPENHPAEPGHSPLKAASASVGASAGALANWAGAALSVGLIVGIGVWGYKLLVRDVSGVPVVRAVDGPMRIQPEDRGGSQADNQGLSVNSVAAEGMAAATADRLVLAPPPVELDADDQPLPVLGALSDVGLQDAETVETIETPATPQMASIQALAEQLASGAAPLGTKAENTYVAPDAPATPVLVAAVATPELVKSLEVKPVLGGLRRSLRPQLRPVSLRTQAAPVPSVEAVEAMIDVDPASLPAGTRLVQLGAFDSSEVAKSEWARLDARFGTYLDGKKRVIQRAQSGGRTFYRLRAMGFEDIAAARRFCSALAAERADCIPVVTR